MSNVLFFPPRGEKVREVAGWLLRVAIEGSKIAHSARVIAANYSSSRHGEVKGHTTRTDCGLLLGFIPEDKALEDTTGDVIAIHTPYRQSDGEFIGRDCQRCRRIIQSEVTRMLTSEPQRTSKKGSKK
jgi:hypothetical protein